MKKSILILILSISIGIFAQDSTKTWKTSGDVGFNSSQVGFTNWAQGGQNTVSGLAFFHLNVNWRKGIWYWNNYFGTEYGLMQQGTDIVKKTNDLIEYQTKFGRDLNKKYAIIFFGSFKTQYTKGYDYEKSYDIYNSDFMAPAYTIAGIGIDYKPTDYLSIYFSPLTYKQTYVGDDSLAMAGAYGVQKLDIDENGNIIHYKNVRHEMGAYFDLMFKKDIAENVNFMTTLNLFSNYLDRPQNIDVNWKVEILMKINSYLNASVKTQLIYDHDIDIAGDKNPDGTYQYGPKTQFMEAISVGLIYKFGTE